MRLLLLLVTLAGLLGMVVSGGPSHEPKSGGDLGQERFGKLLQALFLLGVLLILTIIVLGILSATGVFQNERIDPPA